ncbi:PREDICTED: uncharacterized protein LOC109162453 [Ipomoea nil]|uniref:uncharacterized protein LOC109162453 n=1 Tax=Ipomoea nil TaxID=35883 RepID=UPI0009014973|nr:PREDICTED: uncharacterized protein LOC109162453 [Ipomoea nil]
MREENHRKEQSLSMGWDNNDVTVSIVEVRQQVVTIKIESAEWEKEAYVSFVYASCNVRERRELWDCLENLAKGEIGQNSWAVMGDFNCILRVEEKKGGTPYRIAKSKEFQECIDRAMLSEVAYYGGTYTWWNGREGDQAVWKQLDRCLVNNKWEDGRKTYTQYLSKAYSDHSPMVVNMEAQIKMGRKPFIFLNVWSDHEQFMAVVKGVWSQEIQGNAMFRLKTKLKNLRMELKKWNWETFGNIFEKVKEQEEKMETVEKGLQNDPSENNLILYKKTQAEMKKALTVEEKYWQQKAHMQWVVEGEKNTRYFHGMVRERRRKQTIHKIKNEKGKWVEEQEQIANLAVGFYQKLFEAEETQLDLTNFECLQERVTEEENGKLVQIPSMEEIRSCIFNMNPNSSPGPDGFGGGFYQSCWEVIKGDLYEVIKEFFEGKALTKFITHTTIVLIPKTPNPATFADFRPISLSNFCNKIISKIMVTRLAEILSRLIGPSQAGFVKERNIIDNILLAQELCHGMKEANEDVVLKLDMAKAYDRMSWKCVLAVLEKFGFCTKWIELVERTINNIWYSVVVNGSQHGVFHSTRGLRQGDPLSPSLFIIAAELLSCLLGKNGVTFSQAEGGPGINHLSFADDMIIFTSGKGGALSEVMKTLECYEKQSGQFVNKNKSGFYMHPKVRGEVIQRVKKTTKCQHREFPFTYLGCPIYLGRKRVHLFSSLIDRISARCKGWQSRLLSPGGKAVLIKSELQALPMYIFSAINPPKAVIKQIERIFADFFWGKVDGKQKYHWSSWESLTKATDRGGVGFTSLKEMIAASGTRLWWHFRTEKSLWGDYLKAKYCKRSNPVCKVWQYKDSHSGEGAIASVLNIGGKRTATESLREFFRGERWEVGELGEGVRRLTARVRIRDGVQDVATWKPDTKGQFSFAAAKAFERKQLGEKACHKHWSRKIWANHVPWKMAFLSWRVFKRKIPMDDVLIRFGFNVVSRCSCCSSPTLSSLQHVFCRGEIAREVWGYFAKSLGINLQIRYLEQVCYSWWGRKVKNRLERFIVQRLPMIIIWEIWVSFTQCKYGGMNISAARIKFKVAKVVAECITSRWPMWDPFPPNWNVILRRVDGFGVQRKIVKESWCKPPMGWVKVNLAESKNGQSYSFFIRNGKGQFCLAGIYSSDLFGPQSSLKKEIVKDVRAWCRRKKLCRLEFETDEPGFKYDNAGHDDGLERWNSCSSRVNSLAVWIANKWEGLSLVFWKVGSLPQGFMQLLAIEGVPHFALLPGQDLA